MSSHVVCSAAGFGHITLQDMKYCKSWGGWQTENRSVGKLWVHVQGVGV